MYPVFLFFWGGGIVGPETLSAFHLDVVSLGTEHREGCVCQTFFGILACLYFREARIGFYAFSGA